MEKSNILGDENNWRTGCGGGGGRITGWRERGTADPEGSGPKNIKGNIKGNIKRNIKGKPWDTQDQIKTERT